MCRVYGVSTLLGIIVSLFVVVVLAMTKQQGEVFARRFSESFYKTACRYYSSSGLSCFL
jgi:hypothetical protein